MDFVIDGLRYYVDLWDSPTSNQDNAFPLLLLHGFTGSASSWRKFETQWSSASKVFAIDIVGHGRTDSPLETSRYNIESVAKDLNELMDRMGMEQADILGYSMGGRLALTFAINYPERVRKLILESSSPGLEKEAEREARRIQDEKLATRIQQDGIQSFVDYWEDIPLFQSQKQLPENVRSEIRNERLGNSAIGLINSLKGMGTGVQPSWWDKLEGYVGPTLLLTGSLDEKFCEIAKKMQQHLKNASFITILECGHSIHVEKPKIFGTIVNEFLLNDKG
ncbi:2-succinyl-6-hydroxy-2,4-cyclohexadiene-1-carboxylate synthase [Cytobacillus sp. FJAT-53684]|uniref:Putative 2-succinyl-6-hydroxy-2,4-cyclohexadiene-1-carboxylate synthase n=1 Tax=Cytobacillus mangrovibacter TaxID=3299024 RepID=A0ABW6K5M3_9BACI